MDRLEAMSIVLTVVEAGSLSAAARRLKTPLATVSRKVSDLEAHLRTKLFNRSSRKLMLTDAGTTYVTASKRILADITEAERAASGEYAAPTGELVMTSPVGMGRMHMIPILGDFLAAYPDIDVRLILADRVLSLFEDNVDVAVRIGPLPDSSLIALRVGTVRRTLVASPAYLAARGTPRTPEDLERHDCITYTGLLAPDVWNFVRDNRNIEVPVRSRLIVTSVESACDAARAGIGLTAAFSYHVDMAVKEGSLVTVLDDFQRPNLLVNLLYAANRFLPLKLRAFLDFTSPRLKARLDT